MDIKQDNQIIVSNIDVRTANRIRVLQLLFHEENLTQMDIKNRLHLSGPTVTQAVQLFMGAGLVREGKEMPSSGGRKPHLIEFCYDAYHAVGVEIRKHHADICIINLQGHVTARKVYHILFENNDTYWKQINALIHETIEINKEVEHILGVGIAFPGEISPSGKMVYRATVLGRKNLALDIVQKNIDFPIHIEYGANAAGFGAVWRADNLQDAVYVIVTNNGVAGSVILNNKIYSGLSGKSGAFGHIVLDPNGKKCFCGGRGCWSAYCSLYNLIGNEEDKLQTFFEKLDAKDPESMKRWDEYLTHFAQAVGNIFLSYDADIIIGGELAPYLEPRLQELKDKVNAYPVLAEETQKICVDMDSVNPMAEGAALTFVSQFLNNELEGFRLEDIQ